MEINERLYYWRNLKRMSVYKLSKLSGVSENHIRNLENGIKQPTIKTLQALTDSLNITLSEFFNTDNNDVTYLSDGEKKILNAYRRLSKDKADILIDFYEKMCEE
ncbi:MAG: helix-turn-helix transcriptional regulator [Ruminococcus sp.]|nr:helix-turn-helix transcriptional regulator [Ruminococcus sp.]